MGANGASESHATLAFEGVAQQEFVDGILADLPAFLADSPVATDTDQFLFGLAVSEILTNIVQHGTAGATIRALFARTDAEFTARIDDTSAPAHLDWSAVAMPGEDAESGRGLALALTSLDELRQEPLAGGNTWWLVRQVPGEIPGLDAA